MMSSPTFLTPTRTPRRWAALPRREGDDQKSKSPPEFLQKLPEGQREALLGVLAQDPRPQYQNDPERVYGMSFGGWDVKFRVKDGVLTVLSLAETEHQ